jgi:hypothetical protein
MRSIELLNGGLRRKEKTHIDQDINRQYVCSSTGQGKLDLKLSSQLSKTVAQCQHLYLRERSFALEGTVANQVYTGTGTGTARLGRKAK